MPALIKVTLSLCLLICLSTALKAKDKPTNLTAPKEWQSKEEKTHKWVGKIWSTKEQRFIEPATLEKALKNSRYVLLGETHDNPDHHRLQANIIGFLTETAKAKNSLKPALVMEMIRVDQMHRLESYLASEQPKAELIGAALQWQANGWPSWTIYQPIGEQIVAHQLDVYPGLAHRRLNTYLIKSNIFALPEAEQKNLKLTSPLAPDLQKALEEDIRLSHCNKLPERVINPMANVQRFRDAWMADVMITAATDQKSPRQVILIAGAGHTRPDRGAPWYLRARQAPEHEKTISLQFAEIKNKANAITDLAATAPDGTPAADYIWVTPRQKRGNMCDRIPDFGKKNSASPKKATP